MSAGFRRRVELRQKLVREGRAPRPTPRFVGGRELYEDPAPDWYWRLVDAVLDRAGHLADGGEALARRAVAWCEGAEAESRLAACVAVLEARRRASSTPRVDDLTMFLDSKGAP